MKNCVQKNFKNSLFENSYSWKFFIIDPKFVSQNNFHHYEKFKRRKNSQKNTITNIILYIRTFSNNISNHHFHKIYTGHQFLHLSSNCMHLYVNLDVVNCDDDKGRITHMLISHGLHILYCPYKVQNIRANIRMVCLTFKI